MLAFSHIPPSIASSGCATSSLKMSMAAPSSVATIASTISNASSSSAAAASTTAPQLSSWVSAFASNKHYVGSAWILSSAILTTYSTTKFLKYRSEQDNVLSSSSGEGGGNKVLSQFRSILNSSPQTKTKLSRASLLTLYRFSGSLILGLLIHSQFYDLSKLLPRFLQTVQVAQKFLLPSLFLFIANYSNSIALDRIGISLTYTSKCGIPLITVLFTLLLDGFGALPAAATLLSLLPIAIGIGAASWNSPHFELFGFLAAVISTTSQAALNVVSKRVMRKTGVKGVEAQRAMVFVALGIGLFMTWANHLGGKLKDWREYDTNLRTATVVAADEKLPPSAPHIPSSHPPTWLASLAVLAYHMEYILSFSFVGLVEPITYGTCDALRRLLIIITGRKLFGGDKFSKTNLGGILMALLGALMFSITSSR